MTVMSKLPDFEAWAIFAKVAETGSFARAAHDLGMSQATVSKAVARLEARMQTVLLHRTSRRMSLTHSGHAARLRAERLLMDGEAIEAEISEQAQALRGLIRIAAPMSFGISHLAPLLPAFMAEHPEITLEMQFADELVDLVAQRFDLALRISTLQDSSLLARRLCAVRILLVGTPAYFEQHGRPQHPHDLAGHRFLHYTNSRTGSNWCFTHPVHGEVCQPVDAFLQANNAEALAPALYAGQGVALQPEFLVWNELQSGQLEAVMSDWQVAPIALHLVMPPGRGRPIRVQVLMDYLAGEFAIAPWASHT